MKTIKRFSKTSITVAHNWSKLLIKILDNEEIKKGRINPKIFNLNWLTQAGYIILK